jgi:hypothetical protein
VDIAIEQPARAHLITAGGRELPVPAPLRHASADPSAVHLDFPPEAALDGKDVAWTFSHALLEEGLQRQAGAGDVHLRPCGVLRTVSEPHPPPARPRSGSRPRRCAASRSGAMPWCRPAGRTSPRLPAWA